MNALLDATPGLHSVTIGISDLKPLTNVQGIARTMFLCQRYLFHYRYLLKFVGSITVLGGVVPNQSRFLWCGELLTHKPIASKDTSVLYPYY